MYKKVTLDNGLRVVMENIPYVKSVSTGIWIGTGSRNENSKNNGISHFIEHMFFKGTKNRSAKEIAQSIDNIGGQLNAFTGKECTCFYTKTLDSHIDIAIDVLADMMFNSKFDEKDIQTEKKVVGEEIYMYEDSPEELVHDVLARSVWKGNPLGYPILGTRKALNSLDRDMIFDYLDNNYYPGNCVIAVAGSFDEDNLIGLIKKYFADWKPKSGAARKPRQAKFNPGFSAKRKDTEQVHICFAFRGIEHGSEYTYPLLALNNIFGGGMSSSLFQKVREEKGLVYSIFSYPSSYKNAGLFTIYAAMNPKHLKSVVDIVMDEINLLKEKGIEEDVLEKSKEQLKGNYILGLESTSSRMNSIGKSELLLERIYTPEEILQKIDKVDLRSVKEVTDMVFDTESLSFTAVGNIDEDADLSLLFRN